MNPPRIIRIMGQRWTVKQTKALHVEEDGQHFELLGLTQPDFQTIDLVTGVGPDRAREVFLHEALHGMVAIAALKDILQPEQEERAIKRLSPILLQFLRENPKALEYITGRWVGGVGSAT